MIEKRIFWWRRKNMSKNEHWKTLGFSDNKFTKQLSRALGAEILEYQGNKNRKITLMMKSYVGFKLVGDGFRGSFVPYCKCLNDDDLVFLQHLPKFHHLEFRRVDRDFTLERLLRSANLPFQIKYLDTIIIDLQSITGGNVLAYLPAKTRNIVRKAERKNLHVAYGTFTESTSEEFYKKLRSTFKRSGGWLLHRSSFFRQLAINLDTCFLHSITICDGSSEIAGGLFLKVNKVFYYMSGYSTTKGNELGANNYLQYAAIKLGKQLDCQVYDMGGAGHSGIDKFKLSFGGKKLQTHRYVVQSNILKITLDIIKKCGISLCI